VRTSPFLLAAALVAVAIPMSAPAQDSVLRNFEGATGWLNSPPIGPAELRGKVVVVDFWTYTCVNWLRTLPYVRAWADKYKDQGLVVIGVHTPEFEFEKNPDNVRRAARDMQVRYPVGIDSQYSVWRAFDNHAWPAVYLIDARGRVRYTHFGEGEYAATEKMIQQLLVEAGAASVPRDLVSPDARGSEVGADWANVKSPETYLGHQRSESRVAVAPTRLRLNQWTSSGDWMAKKDAVLLNKPNGRIAYRFHARDVNLILGPASAGNSVRFRVLIDGKPPGTAHGADSDAQGNGAVSEQRLYQLVRQPGSIADRLFEIEFIDPGVEAFAFTFG
jgi:thiol-disulfide isomerase/thioredoxin